MKQRETKVRQFSCLYDVHQTSGNLLPMDLSKTSGLQRFRYCIQIICMFILISTFVRNSFKLKESGLLLTDFFFKQTKYLNIMSKSHEKISGRDWLSARKKIGGERQ